MDAAGAASMAWTYLAQHIVPTVSAQVGPTPVMHDALGGAVPGPMVRANQWVQVQNVRNQYDPEGVGIILPITQTQCDEAGLVTVSIGSLPWNLYGNIAAMQAQLRQIQAGVNLVTAAPA